MLDEITGEQLPGIGKVDTSTFGEVIFPRLGAQREAVLVGPRHGVDVGIVDIGDGQVMALTTDPFFVVPEYGWERAGWFAVHIVASDAATSGLRPSYLTVDLNLPLTTTREDLEGLWESVHATCREIGLAVVTGHTGRYDGCTFPMVGGATAIALGSRESYVTPAMAQVGDAVLVTKGPAIETTALFGVTFPDQIGAVLGPETADAAEKLFWQMSVVKDARVAASCGLRDRGVTAMHDATERGVLGGLVEIAEASGNGILVDLDAMRIRPEVRAICDYFGIDPFTASSEGMLLLTCRPAQVGAVSDALAAAAIEVFRVGEILPASEGLWVVQGGHQSPLEAPASDPFWPAYRRAWESWR